MSTSFLEACAQRSADAESPDERPPQLARQMSTVFRELDRAIVNYLGLPDLVHAGLRINRSFSAAARARVAELWPQLNSLLGAPFRLTRHGLLQQTKLARDHRKVGDPEVQILAAAMAIGALAKCTYISLNINQIGDAGVAALASACISGALSQCTYLGLAMNQIGDAGIIAFADACGSGALPQCRELYLNSNKFGDAGVTALALACASGSLARCRDLRLGFNQIGDAGFTALAQVIKSVSEGSSGALPQLKDLYICAVNPALRAACEARSITYY